MSLRCIFWVYFYITDNMVVKALSWDVSGLGLNQAGMCLKADQQSLGWVLQSPNQWALFPTGFFWFICFLGFVKDFFWKRDLILLCDSRTGFRTENLNFPFKSNISGLQENTWRCLKNKYLVLASTFMFFFIQNLYLDIFLDSSLPSFFGSCLSWMVDFLQSLSSELGWGP